MDDGRERVIGARHATFGQGSARKGVGSSQPGHGVDGRVLAESVGVVDFTARRALMEERASPVLREQLRGLLESAPGATGANEAEVAHVQLFVGEEVYERHVSQQRWVHDTCGWWERPLWPHDPLPATGDVRSGQSTEVRGACASEYVGVLDPTVLSKIDPHLPVSPLLGRRSRRHFEVRVCLDEPGRAVRTAWAVVPPPRRAEGISVTTTEFWDFGVHVDISAHLRSSPWSQLEIVRDLRTGH